MKNISRISFLWCCIGLLLMAGCKSCGNKPNVSNINVKLKVFRFEKDLAKLDQSNYKNQFDSLNIKYPDFLPFYLKAVAKVISPADTAVQQDTLLHYLQDPYIKMLYDSSEKKYSDIKDIEQEFTDAFKYFKYYFPRQPVPDIITYIDGPPYGLTYGDNILAVGIDGYLGEKFPAYTLRPEPIPHYELRKFKKEYIVPNTMNVFASGLFNPTMTGNKLLDAMLFRGKIYFFVKKVLPDTPDSLIFGYPDTTLTWLNNNEEEIWKFFIKNKLIYENDPLVYSKYVNPAPNTSGMPPQAPGNIGSWVGYRIVEGYMKRNPKVSLEKLMADGDAQKILQESKYKP